MSLSSFRRLAGFGRGWYGGGSISVDESKLSLPDGSSLTLTRVSRPGHRRGPAWIALHGITRPGPEHPQLMRFARAVAMSGSLVVIPEIAPWRELRLDTGVAAHVVRATLEALEADPSVVGPPGLIGFSFGGPQVIRIAADPVLGPRLAGVASFGGFADIEAMLRFQMTGVVAEEAGPRRIRPDPYARWIIAANYLPSTEGGADLQPVADALGTLAREAGNRRTPAWDSVYDPRKAELQASLSAEQGRVFRLFAPPSGSDPVGDGAEVEGWIVRLVEAARRRAPDLELPDGLELEAPAHILHGRNDALVPWTEAGRMADRISAPRPVTTVTALFAHAGRDSGGLWSDALEAWRLTGAVRRILSIP